MLKTIPLNLKKNSLMKSIRTGLILGGWAYTLSCLMTQSALAAVSVEHPIANGAGISYPSTTDAIADNPAALSFNRRTRILGAVGSQNKQFNPFDAIGRLHFGSGSMGGAIGIHSYKVGGESRMAADYGLGAYADALKASIGIGGSSALKGGKLLNDGNLTNDSNQVNLGTILNPQGNTRVGFALIGVLGGVDHYATGISMDGGDGTVLSIDGSMNHKNEGKTVRAALGIHLMDFQITAGYGIRVDKKADSWVSSGFGAGVGMRLGKDLEIYGVYNHHYKYYAAAAVSF